MGGDLMTLLKEEPVLSEDSVHSFASDIAMALQHMHSSGLVSPKVFPSALPVTPTLSASIGTALPQHCRVYMPASFQVIRYAQCLGLCMPVHIYEQSHHCRCTAI